jgi:pimeloyl-ACP methyl ester carboxylesterase
MKQIISSLLSAVFTVSAFASIHTKDDGPLAKTQTYVLVHGAWQASWVWEAVRNDLLKNGNKVIVVELPGHGNDNTPAQSLSLDIYRDKVIEAISKADGKVILVGHSMGGMVITAVAEKVPGKISKLVYIGAFLPASGQALTDLAHLTIDVKRDSLDWLFINDGTAVEKEMVLTHYRAEPAIPFTNKVELTKEGFGAVEKLYIKTTQDNVISPGLQDRMIAAAGIKTVYEINTSHSPFLSQPKTVSDLLIKIGQ